MQVSCAIQLATLVATNRPVCYVRLLINNLYEVFKSVEDFLGYPRR